MPLAQQSAVEIAFADLNGDDNDNYRVSHEWVDPTGIVQATFHGDCAGQCTRTLLTRPAGDFVFVLTGFRFTCDSEDHHLGKIAVSANNSQPTKAFEHIRDLGVVANANSIDTIFGDSNPADSADWGLQVQYATLL
ncbi:hypothetical protein AB0I51_39315 [Streptomyces sp. NPDC050549]|uniref:hypothetical protein n=1 Tax=Streptomyces sp. NPDC050549 TaxID=3155406 RepID=UPI00342CD8CE